MTENEHGTIIRDGPAKKNSVTRNSAVGIDIVRRVSSGMSGTIVVTSPTASNVKLDPGQRSIRYRQNGVNVQPPELIAGTPNLVSTTRFTIYTWIPKSLFYQFQRVANIYFLFIAIIVCFPWSPKKWQSKVFPYLCVLGWTALKDGYEDLGRKRDDDIENNKTCWRFDINEKIWNEILWKEVLPGDIIWTPCDGQFPADLLILYVPSATGAFISTVNLDGETNLKPKTSPRILDVLSSKVDVADLAQKKIMAGPPPEVASGVAAAATGEELDFQLACPVPMLSNLNGSIHLKDSPEPGSVSVDNFLPRGCILRNTPWTLSVAAYVGEDTKSRLNASLLVGKVSNLQFALNRCVQGLLVCLFFTCMYMATMSVVHGGAKYNWMIIFLRYTITIYHVVPISLYVGFEVLKLALGYLINVDAQMVDPDTKEFAKARTADLVEEMGQVDFIFSDKTGTLTANEMRFARCSVDNLDPGDFLPQGGDSFPPAVSNVKQIWTESGHPQREALLWFFTCLAVCHSVQVDEDKGTLSGPSPDEVALVQASKDVGIAFAKREAILGKNGQQLTVVGPTAADTRNFHVLYEIEFSSDRKRMSVICEFGDSLYCITKGADNVMNGLLSTRMTEKDTESINKFSKQGLRTLVVASKSISREAFAPWESDYQAALCALEGREEKLAECGARMEQDLQFAGITAVEDRLQDGVPQAIAKVKSAGVRLWMLTGDKTETAVDIARSCRLFTREMEIAYVTGAEDLAQTTELLKAAREKLAGKASGGLVLDGQTVYFVLQSDDAAQMLYNLGIGTSACVCCRLSPAQKRKLVEVVRARDPRTITLAIGDGANDVPMIQGAHLGIGIRGKEGAQAVQASDIAISQFRFLVPLLLCHGRRAYRRIATFLCYYLYKNVCLVWSDLLWAHQNGFTGQVAFPEWLSTASNAVFTSWPVLVVLAMDVDVPDKVAVSNPLTYLEGPQREWFNAKIFTTWMLNAAYHGCLCWIVPNVVIGSTDYESVDFWRASAIAFTLNILVVSLKLLLGAYSPTSKWTLGSLSTSVLLYICVLFFLGYSGLGQKLQPNLSVDPEGDPYVPAWIFSNGTSLVLIFLYPFGIMLIDFIGTIYWHRARPSPLDVLRGQASTWDLEELNDLPEIVEKE